MEICRMISIDSSTKSTGLTIWDNGAYKKSLVIDLSSNSDLESRFEDMSKSLLSLLQQYTPYIVYMEEMVVPRNAQTQRFLTRLQGVVYAYCVLNDCEFNTLRPSEWRKLVGISQDNKKRKDYKAAAIKMVKEQFGLTVSDDEAESILIGQAAINRFRTLEEKPIKEKKDDSKRIN